MNIALIDGIGGNYNGDSFNTQTKIGGTEITIINVAELLANQTEHKVCVFQKYCSGKQTVNKVDFANLNYLEAFSPDVLVGIRPRRLIVKLAKRFKHVPCFYWMHDIPSHRLWKYKRKFRNSGCEIIAISEFQTQLIRNAWRGQFWQQFFDKFFNKKNVPIHVIYNPILDNLTTQQIQCVDSNKLIFFSAPDRGLEMILKNFFLLLQRDNSFILYIAHPGYASLGDFQDKLSHPNIKVLGCLSHSEIIEHIRSSLCVFYPQNIKPECFGMVYAESNAVGTPVLAHDFGAAKEVLSKSEQLIDATQPNVWVERLLAWKQQRPQIQLNEKLREKSVLDTWLKLLNKQQD